MNKSIASIVALAVTTSLALANGGGEEKKNPYKAKTAWKPGAGTMLADSDELSIKLTNRIQVQWVYQTPDAGPDVNNFSVRRARVKFSGHAVTRALTYVLNLDATDDGGGDNIVKDAYANWNFVHNDSGHVGVRLGQAKSLYGLESTGSSSKLFFMERSSASRTFSDLRSNGVNFSGGHMENKLRWSAGLQNGVVANGSVFNNGESAPNAEEELNFVAHVNFDPMGNMMGGGSNLQFHQGDLHHNGEVKGTVGLGMAQSTNTSGAGEVDCSSVNFNTAWRLGNGLALQGEFFEGSNSPDAAAGGGDEDSTGFYAQASYTLAKNPDSMVQWGFGLRYSLVDHADGSNYYAGALNGAAGEISELSVVANMFYAGHNCKTQIEYTTQSVEPDGAGSADNDQLGLMFTLVF